MDARSVTKPATALDVKNTKDAKTESLIKNASPMFFKREIKSSRVAWSVGIFGSLSIIPMGLVGGIYRMSSSQCSNGLSTIYYSFMTGVTFTCISAASVASPSLGAKYAMTRIIDTEQVYKKNPKDGFDQLDPLKYPRDQFSWKPLQGVKTDKCELDAIEISHTNSRDDRILIKFCGAGHNYQEVAQYLCDDAKALQCKVIIANYPGVTKQDYKVSSSDDLCNVGVALVHHTAARYNLDNQQIASRVILEGFSLGGAGAVYTAANIKQLHHVDIPVFVNRSFWNYTKISGAFYNTYLGLPVCYWEALHTLYEYASGNQIAIDLAKAFSYLNPDVVDCINVDDDILIPRGMGFADAAKANSTAYYFKWNGQRDPDFKSIHPVVSHTAPNHTLINVNDQKTTAQEYFRLFANRMWNRNQKKEITLAPSSSLICTSKL